MCVCYIIECKIHIASKTKRNKEDGLMSLKPNGDMSGLHTLLIKNIFK